MYRLDFRFSRQHLTYNLRNKLFPSNICAGSIIFLHESSGRFRYENFGYCDILLIQTHNYKIITNTLMHAWKYIVSAWIDGIVYTDMLLLYLSKRTQNIYRILYTQGDPRKNFRIQSRVLMVVVWWHKMEALVWIMFFSS